jgi:hypothetical protein
MPDRTVENGQMTQEEYESPAYWRAKVKRGSREEVLWNLMRLEVKEELASMRLQVKDDLTDTLLQVKDDLADARTVIIGYKEELTLADARVVQALARAAEADARVARVDEKITLIDDFMMQLVEVVPRMDRLMAHVQLLQRGEQIAMVDQVQNLRRFDRLEAAPAPVDDPRLEGVMQQASTIMKALNAMVSHITQLDVGEAHTRIARARSDKRLDALEEANADGESLGDAERGGP